MSENNENLNQGFVMHLDEAEVITVPIDTTLTQEGTAADAAAVGAALALKADASSVNIIDVNGEAADNQGHIILYGTKVPMSGTDSTPVTDAIAAAAGRTAADIPMSSDAGAQTIAQVIGGLGGETAESIPMSTADSTPVATKIMAVETTANSAVKSVNSTQPDSNGNVQINEVPLAANLSSDQNQITMGAFLLRTTGGSRSVGSGSAQLQEIRGAMVHTGVVEEVLTVETEGTLTIDEVEIDRDTWVEYVEESGTTQLDYDGAWKIGGTSVDIADYGITVTGSPTNGDKIIVTYVKGDRGTITPATPTAFRATGWNLFNASTGYARVADYGGAYHIGGSYSAVKYSATLNGEQSAITVDGNRFTPPGDGFIWVTGGDATSTYITPEWTDWVNGPDVAFAAYAETVISLASIMTAQFPYGLLAVGAVYDSISIDQGKYYSRIARIDYDEDDLQDLIDGGIAYEADENYIYYVKTTADSGNITLSGAFTASDHGLEIVDGSEVAPYIVILYGQNLKAKLTSDVVTISQQELTAGQKAQIQQNIGVDAVKNDLSTDMKNLLVVESRVLFDNKSVTANEFFSGTYSFTAKSGYTAIGIVGVDINNASSSGANSSYAAASICRLSGTTSVYFRARNYVNSAAKLKCTVAILFKKNI